MDSREKKWLGMILKEEFHSYILLLRKILKVSPSWLQTLRVYMLVTPVMQDHHGNAAVICQLVVDWEQGWMCHGCTGTCEWDRGETTAAQNSALRTRKRTAALWI